MYKLIILILLLSGSAVYGQSSALEVISIEQGLSQGFVSNVAQDRDGFLWFTTGNGLNRYDGYEFSVFRNDPYDTLSIIGNNLFGMAATGDYLWLMPNALQFNIFHRATRRAYLVPIDLSWLKEYFKVVPERENGVWVLLQKEQSIRVFRLQWPRDFMEQAARGVNLSQLFSWQEIAADVHDMELSEDGRQLWMLGKDKLWIRDVASGKTDSIALPETLRGLHLVRNQLLSNVGITPDVEGGTWVFARNQLARYQDRQWKIFPLGFTTTGILNINRKSGIIWLRSGPMAYGFDLRRLPARPMPEDASYRLFIPEQAICSLTDRDGNVWFGTNTRGIRKFSPRRGVFKNYLAGHSFYSSPVFDNQGRIWLTEPGRSTMPGGVFDPVSEKLTPFSDLGLFVKGNESLRIVAGENDRFWLATANGWNTPPGVIDPMLIEYSQKDGVLDVLPFPKAFDAPIRFEMSYQPPGELWFANHHQLMRFTVATRSFSVFSTPTRPEEFSGVFALVKTQDGTWWAGTPNGLLRAAPDGKGAFVFTLLRTNPANRNSVPGNVVKSLLIDPADPNLLWIGTSDNGLSRLDIRRNQYIHYTTENGLPDNTIYGILPEPSNSQGKKRALWLSTNRGLTRFMPEEGRFQYFFKSDGLQDNEFNTYAYGASPGGELIFGGVNGFTLFNPADIAVNNRIPSIKITGLRINGKPVNPRDSLPLLDTDICFAERIELPHYQNNLQFAFAADDYTNPARNQFAFYLEGAEPQWVHRGLEHTAQYLNLAPGHYVFHVKAANSDGVWNETPVSLQIVIRPPWYRTWWAYGLYALLVSGMLYVFYRTQWRRKLERAEAARLKELDAFKSRLYVNITHEFRTPLTVILGLAREARSEPEQRTKDALLRLFEPIERNGARLLRLINQILDLAKLENKALQPDLRKGDVIAYLKYLMESFQSLANARNQMLRFRSPLEQFDMDFDPERLSQIVSNLISNAMKFTHSGGSIFVTANHLTSPDRLKIEVRDTGVGIPADILPHIFDRFFSAPPRATTFQKDTTVEQSSTTLPADAGSTGIGLALARELARLMGGDIYVESHTGGPQRGSVFTVVLPVTKAAAMQTMVPDEAVAVLGLEMLYPVEVPQEVVADGLPVALIVEDNADVADFVKAVLAGTYRVLLAYNGRAGMEMALETIPDLVVTDLMMPEMDGLELCNALKNDPRTSHIPVVLLSARAAVEDRIAGLSRGADAYLVKPFHREELLATLSGLIELRRKLQQHYASAPVGVSSGSDTAAPLEDIFLSRIREAVEERMGDSTLSGEDVCRKLGMSYPVVYRKLSALTGRSLNVYIRLIRLQKARELLSATELSVSEIAYQTGFNDPKFFSRVFAEEFGATPTTFRKSI